VFRKSPWNISEPSTKESGSARVLGVVIFGITSLLGAAPLTQTGTTAEQPSMRLGMDVTGPGQHAILPIELVQTGENQLKQVIGRVRFPVELLSFLEVKLAPGSEGDPLGIDTAVEQNQQDASETPFATLVVSLTSDSAMGEGLLASLVFLVLPEALQHNPVQVIYSGMGVTRKGEEVELAQNQETQIIVMEIPEAPEYVPACFFYMH
jgi:hypothetical protein